MLIILILIFIFIIFSTINSRLLHHLFFFTFIFRWRLGWCRFVELLDVHSLWVVQLLFWVYYVLKLLCLFCCFAIDWLICCASAWPDCWGIWRGGRFAFYSYFCVEWLLGFGVGWWFVLFYWLFLLMINWRLVLFNRALSLSINRRLTLLLRLWFRRWPYPTLIQHNKILFMLQHLRRRWCLRLLNRSPIRILLNALLHFTKIVHSLVVLLHHLLFIK